ncbi:MAG: hypothetical protein R3C01_05095 [Planctomycetaceae bacterium]
MRRMVLPHPVDDLAHENGRHSSQQGRDAYKKHDESPSPSY